MADIINFMTYRKHRKIRRLRNVPKPVQQGKRRRIKPKRQGDLDGLCGVYSIINAMCAVYKRKKIDKYRLFKHLLLTLEKDTTVTAAILDGTYKKHLNNMMETAVAYVGKKHGARITINPLFKHNSNISLKSYWKTLQEFLSKSKRRCVIVGYRGKHDHWTVIYDVTNDALKLLDSGGTKRIRRHSCQVGKPYTDKYYHLIPSQVWGISLKD